MQVLQLTIIFLFMLCAAMYMAFAVLVRKIDGFAGDLDYGVELREKYFNTILERLKNVSGEAYEEMKNKMDIIDKYKSLKDRKEKIKCEDDMEDLVLYVLSLKEKYKELNEDYIFLDALTRVRDTESRIYVTKFTYNGFVDKYNLRREKSLSRFFVNIYKFKPKNHINLSERIKNELNKPVSDEDVA